MANQFDANEEFDALFRRNDKADFWCRTCRLWIFAVFGFNEGGSKRLFFALGSDDDDLDSAESNDLEASDLLVRFKRIDAPPPWPVG